MTLACRVEINPDRVEIKISRHRLAAFLTGQPIDPTMQDHKSDRGSDDVLTLAVPARLKRVGREMRSRQSGIPTTRWQPIRACLRIIARAHDIQKRLSQNPKLTVHDVARDERVSAAYLYTLLRLPWLAPDITTAIVNGEQPRHLNAMTLMRRASRLPPDWHDQRTLLGFC